MENKEKINKRTKSGAMKRPIPSDYTPELEEKQALRLRKPIKVWVKEILRGGNQSGPQVVEKGEFIGVFKSVYHCSCMLSIWHSSITKALDTTSNTKNYIMEWA